MTKNRPNIVLLILDSARRDMFGCYGNDEGLTPNIDDLAANGLVCMDHYAASCGSAASHTSIFTGQHPARHGMLHNLCEIRQDLYPFPRLLKSLGYKTFGHCKMSYIPPVGYTDLFGFDELLSPGNMRNGTGGGMMDAIRARPALYRALKGVYSVFASDERKTRRSAEIQDGQDSVDYIIDRFYKHASGGPIFAYSTLLHPHLPCYPSDIFTKGRPHPDAFKIQQNIHAFANGSLDVSTEGVDSLRTLYKADLEYADCLVGVLVGHLILQGQLKNTMIIITSDHGELLGEHGCINHGAMVWEELFRTPCIIHWPEGIEPRRVDHLTSGMDIVPTIFKLLGREDWLKSNVRIDGESTSSAIDWKRLLVVDSPPAVLPGRYKKFPHLLEMVNVIRRVARTPDYKYVWQSDGKHQLYDMDRPDPEGENIIETRRPTANILHRGMVDFYEKIDPNFEIDKYPVPISPNIRERITDPVVRKELSKEGYA